MMIQLSEEQIRKLEGSTTGKTVTFGEGNLMPVFQETETEMQIAICRTRASFEIGYVVSAETGISLFDDSNLEVMLSVPKNKIGLESLISLSTWIDTAAFKIEEAIQNENK